MTKPKRAINVGDRISWVNGSFVGFGTVKEVLSEKCFVVSDKHEEDNVVHRRQIVKVIRKKKKREPISFWLPCYRAQFDNTLRVVLNHTAYPTENSCLAIHKGADRFICCVKFVEVLES